MRSPALFILGSDAVRTIYGPAQRKQIDALADVLAEPFTQSEVTAHADELARAEVIFSGWGAPKLDEAFLAAAPNLKLFLYGAGTVRGFVTEAFWESGITLCSARSFNAVPVSEFTLAQILLCLKRAFAFQHEYRQKRCYLRGHERRAPGAYQSTVGLVSLGEIGRRVVDRLRGFDLEILVHDPYAPPALLEELGVESVTLEELFRRSHCVSVHTPWLPETEKLIGPDLLRLLPPDGSFINTSRGAVVDEAGLVEVLRERPDLQACLDVTHPEPPPPESPLYELPNVFLTPHIAGAIDRECQRLGQAMVEELGRWQRGEPLQHALNRELAEKLA